MSATLHLKIATPASVLFDSDQVTALRAEDESGSFGILPGHIDFLTVLTPSVLRWHGAGGPMHYCAVEAGVLRVNRGRDIIIACRDGVLGDSLEQLEMQIQAVREKRLDAVRRSRVEQTRMHAQAVRQLLRYLRPGPPTAPDLSEGGIAPHDTEAHS
jgi:F-type H+-transporting ATPase subunit epsilon